MKPFMTLFLCLIFGTVSAQNWRLFKPESLYWYLNPVQDSLYIQGIDFRSYSTYGDTTVIDLGSFARIDTTNGAVWSPYIQIRSGNSNFGNKVVQTTDITRLIFTPSFDQSIDADTITFVNTPRLGQQWTILSNEDHEITGETIRLEEKAGTHDSVWRLNIVVLEKKSAQKREFGCEISKDSGFVSLPIFYDILSKKVQLHHVGIAHLQPYEEMSPEEFFTPVIGTEFHFTENISRAVYRERTQKVVGYTNGRIEYEGKEAGKKAVYYNHPSSPVPVLTGWEPYSVSNGQWSYEWKGEEEVVNPIPGNFQSDSFYYNVASYATSIPAYRFECDKLIMEFNYPGAKGFWASYDDTVFLGSPETVIYRAFMQGLGEMAYEYYEYGKYGGEFYFKKWKYIDIPNECKFGSEQWRLSGIEKGSGTRNRLALFPNPASETVTIQLPEPVIALRATAINGQSYELSAQNGLVEIGHLSNGLYLIQASTSSGIYQAKLSVVR